MKRSRYSQFILPPTAPALLFGGTIFLPVGDPLVRSARSGRSPEAHLRRGKAGADEMAQIRRPRPGDRIVALAPGQWPHVLAPRMDVAAQSAAALYAEGGSEPYAARMQRDEGRDEGDD